MREGAAEALCGTVVFRTVPQADVKFSVAALVDGIG
jgi:hypothetical protein